MGEAFDPYHKWLGIPPEDQPADHYRLLGLKALESDPDAIEAAADQRMAHLRTYQAGKQSDLSQKLLNEVAAAKVCLLKPAKKAAYDEQLRQKLAAKAAATVSAPTGLDLDELLGQPAGGSLQHSHPKVAASKGPSQQVWIFAGAAAGLLVLVVAAIMVFSNGGKEPARPAKVVAISQPIVPPPPKPSPKPTPKPLQLAPEPNATSPIAPPRREDVKPDASVATVPPPQPKDDGTPAARLPTIDMLALVDPAKHAAAGRWEVQPSGLALVQKTSCALIQFPVIPAGSFEFETEFTKLKGDGGTAVIFPVNNSFVHVEVGGYHGRVSGMAVVDGAWGDDARNPTRRPSTIAESVRYKMVVRVRRLQDREIAVHATLDGKSFVDWQGPESVLTGSPFWRMGRPATLSLGVDSAVVVFHTARLRMLDGQANGADGQPLVAAATARRPGEETSDAAGPGVSKPAAEPRPAPAKVGTTEVNAPTSKPAAAGPAGSQIAEKPSRAPVPNEAVQKKLLATMDEIYHFEDATKPAAQVKLAKDLMELAEKSKAAPDEQFTLLRKAAELACHAGDGDLMLDAADAIGAAFEVDAIVMKGKLLARLAEGANDAARVKSFVRAAEKILSQDLAEDRYEAAEAVIALAERIVQKPLGKSFRKEFRDRHLEIQRLEKQWAPVQEAQETLKSHPDDAEANLAVGRWYCVNKDDWEKGLPGLAKGGDSELCQTAQEDLKSPEGAEAQLKLADAWWDLAAKARGALQDALRLRAGYWYKQLLGEATGGLVRVKIQKRLDQIEEIGRPLPGVPAGKMKRMVVNSLGMKLVLIPPGDFLMGSPDSDREARPDEKPQHRVRITRPFYIGAYPVTQGEYLRAMGPSREKFSFPPDGMIPESLRGKDVSRFPADRRSWQDAAEFCLRLSQSAEEQRAGRAYRLPTEAQWEYACRAGTTKP